MNPHDICQKASIKWLKKICNHSEIPNNSQAAALHQQFPWTICGPLACKKAR